MTSTETRLLRVAICFLAACFAINAAAQSSTEKTDDPPLKVDTLLINLPVIVSDREGRRVAGLKQEDFSIHLDGQKQVIDYFANDDVPLDVAIVIDTSGSTARVLGDIKSAARRFVEQLRPVDRAMIVTFDKDIKIVCGFTSDTALLKKKIGKAGTTLKDGSNMNDAVYRLVTKEFAQMKNRKAIIVLTDGFVSGQISNQRLLDTLIESDTVIYPIFYQTQRILPGKVKTVKLSELIKYPPVDYLNAMAVETGGRLFAADGSNFKIAFQSVADELRTQYVLGFYPTESGPSSQNRISIKVNNPEAGIRSKRTIKVGPPAAKAR